MYYLPEGVVDIIVPNFLDNVQIFFVFVYHASAVSESAMKISPHRLVIVLTVALLLRCIAADSTRGGVSSAPNLHDSDSVEFYVMTSSFPYNVPSNIRYFVGSISGCLVL